MARCKQKVSWAMVVLEIQFELPYTVAAQKGGPCATDDGGESGPVSDRSAAAGAGDSAIRGYA